MAIGNDELGNPSALEYVLKGGGKIFAADFGSKSYTYIGETHEVLQNLAVEKETLPNTETCPPGVLLEYVVSTDLKINFASYSNTPANVARFFLGEVTDGTSEVSDENVITEAVVAGTYYDLGYINITTAVVMDETDTTTYVEGTDYILNKTAGMIGIIIGGGIADASVLHVTLSAAATGEHVQYLKGETKTITLRFEGCAQNGEPVIVDFYKVELSGDGDAPLKGDEPVSISFTGACLPDPTKPSTGTLSQYATMRYVNATT
jgi:hypothetical protein